MTKKLLSILLLLMGVVQGSMAQEKEAYAALSEDGLTVTFYYDDQKDSRSGVKQIQKDYRDTGYRNATTAVFDASFADYQPTSTAYWFEECSKMTSISGMENLKTDNVTDMRWVFALCSSLRAST